MGRFCPVCSITPPRQPIPDVMGRSSYKVAPARRGGIYVAVLGAAMVVSLIGMASLASVRAQRLTVRANIDTAKARLYAESGVELAMQWIAADANWRQNRTSGVWVASQTLGDGSMAI